MDIANSLEGLLEERREMLIALGYKDRENKRLEGVIKNLRAWKKRLQEKIDVIEKDPCILDGWDEKFLFDQMCQLRFYRRADGTRRVVLKPRIGRMAIEVDYDKTNASLVRKVMETVSGRKRTGKKQKAGIDKSLPRTSR